jgi:hypothetical protein
MGYIRLEGKRKRRRRASRRREERRQMSLRVSETKKKQIRYDKRGWYVDLFTCKTFWSCS